MNKKRATFYRSIGRNGIRLHPKNYQNQESLLITVKPLNSGHAKQWIWLE